MTLDVVLLILAIVAFLTIILEDIIHINKAKTTLFFGALTWILMYIFSSKERPFQEIEGVLHENLLEIAILWLFLMSAMTFVAYLNHKGLIESFIYRILPEKISERRLLFLIALFSFLFSSISDNITATLVSIALVMPLQIDPKKLLKYVTVIVFAVNSGGVALITGDVTTLMIFLAKKVEIQNLLLLAAPAFFSVMLLALLLSRGLKDQVVVVKKQIEIRGIDLFIAFIFLSTILATIFANIFFQIPPVLTFLFGLSVMLIVGQFQRHDQEFPSMLAYIREIEFDTLLFFLGVLLLVGMLNELKVLDSLARLYFALPHVAANYLIGLLSALIDNVPLTAAVLKANIGMPPAQWLTFTYSVGVGGSLLIIGSAAGIIAMSKVAEVTFLSYMKNLLYLLISYSVGFMGAFWIGRYLL